MFPAMPVQANKQERKLVKVFKSLDAANKESLLAFGDFLATRALNEVSKVEKDNELIPDKPLDIERPDEESVIKAIKRLSTTYPMVDKENILHPISEVMTSHVMQGKLASLAIDDLQNLFLKEYEKINKEE